MFASNEYKNDMTKYYLEKINQNTNDLYYYYQYAINYCPFPKSKREKEIAKKCLKKLLINDPYFILDDRLMGIYRIFSITDIKAIIKDMKLRKSDLSNYIKGMMFYRFGILTKKRKEYYSEALNYLLKVKSNISSNYYYFLSECYAYIDYNKYKKTIKKLLIKIKNEDKGFILQSYMRTIIKNKDLAEFHKISLIWEKLPKKTSYCECYYNDYYTYKGLYLLHTGNIYAIPEILSKAQKVTGCPHLNSYGFNLELVEKLILKKLFKDEVKNYLVTSRRFTKNKKVEKILKKLNK